MKLSSFMKETMGDSPPFVWRRVHDYLALMGGFAFDTGGDPSIPLPETRYTLTPAWICFLAEHRPDLIPYITTDEINDKSKASPLAKALVLEQTLWFSLQITTRLAMGCPSAPSNTLARVCFAVCAFAAWWSKPLDIYEPVLIPIAKNLSAASLCAAMYLRSTTGYQRTLKYGTKCLLECSWPRPAPDVGSKPEGPADQEGHHAVTIEASPLDVPSITLQVGESIQGLQVRYVKEPRDGDVYKWYPPNSCRGRHFNIALKVSKLPEAHFQHRTKLTASQNTTWVII